jgi:hypothetical protein
MPDDPAKPSGQGSSTDGGNTAEKTTPSSEQPATGDGKSPTTSPPALTKLHLYGLALVIGGILLSLLIVIGKFNAEHDTVTGVLGVVIPAFATIGAALFGITVGYNAGESKGEATGKEKGKEQGRAEAQADTADAITAAREQVAAQAKRLLPDPDALDRMHGAIGLRSPAGTERMLLDLGETTARPAELDFSDLASADYVRRTHAYLDEVLAGAES